MVITKVSNAIAKYGNRYKVVTEDDIVYSSKDFLVKEYKIGNLAFNGKYDKKFRERYIGDSLNL